MKPAIKFACLLSACLWLLAPPVLALEGLEQWMGTYYKGKKLGFSHVKLVRTGDEVVVTSRVYFRLESEGVDQSTSFSQETHLTPDLRLKHFSLLQEIMGSRQQVEAKLSNGKLAYRMKATGFDKENEVPFPPEMTLSSTFLFNIVQDGLMVGKKGRFPIFIEAFQISSVLEYEILRRETMEFEGKPVDTYVIYYRVSGMDSTFWVAEDGRLLREKTPQGFESINEPEEVARDLGDEVVSVSSLITLSLVKPQREIPDPDNVHRMTLKLSGMQSPGLVPEDHRQKVLGSEKSGDGTFTETVQVRSEGRVVKDPVSLPIRLFPDADLLGDSPEVQSKHPMIRALSRDLVAGAKDAWSAARQINLWVHSNLEKVLVDTVTALDALNQRRGECQSHTHLFAALARAAGIPTKIVNGLVYSPEYKGFLYHAWPEVFVGEWRALDPTFGQERVDATHIKLSEVNAGDPFKLMEFVGKVQIELIEN